MKYIDHENLAKVGKTIYIITTKVRQGISQLVKVFVELLITSCVDKLLYKTINIYNKYFSKI